jgi:hypothetical protein
MIDECGGDLDWRSGRVSDRSVLEPSAELKLCTTGSGPARQTGGRGVWHPAFGRALDYRVNAAAFSVSDRSRT